MNLDIKFNIRVYIIFLKLHLRLKTLIIYFYLFRKILEGATHKSTLTLTLRTQTISKMHEFKKKISSYILIILQN